MTILKILSISFFLSIISILNAQEKSRPDFDVLSYQINLNITDFEHETISGNTKIKLLALKRNLNNIKLDFANLTVDSILNGQGEKLRFTHKDEKLNIKSKTARKQIITVYYHGKAIQDASWGGFFFDDSVAFNMGVGMTAVPHSYGRVWFPCVDNFTDKARFEFNIRTDANMKAVCSGILKDSIIHKNNEITWHWIMPQDIPPYIANVAVGEYHKITKHYKGIKRVIPIELYFREMYLPDVEPSFANLKSSLKTFETHYGEYLWDRVGYVGVPFNSGAMEHACNISYPEYAIDGTKERETLMAHELSHHWFGNLVTCKTAEDMWLNEGWASFSEALFTEFAYDKAAYKKYVRDNHLKVLQYTHQYDNGYYAVYGLPKNLTYGSTVYDKGADVAHTLRGYMSDELFFKSLKEYLHYYAYKSVDTYEFRDFMSKVSGIDLTDFFESWVFTKGFPFFEANIKNIKKTKGKYQVSVLLKQELRERKRYGKSNKIELCFTNDKLNRVTKIASFDGAESLQTFELDFKPTVVFCDLEEKIADASVDTYHTFKKGEQGHYVFDYTSFSCDIENVKDSAIIQASLNFMPSPNNKRSDIMLSKVKYWTIKIAGKISTYGTFYVSVTDFKIPTKADGITIFYRENSTKKWKPIKTSISKSNDYEAFFTVKNLKAGDYAVGKINTK